MSKPAPAAFDHQLSFLLKHSRLRKQEALSLALRVTASTVSGWRRLGLPAAKRVQAAEAFGIRPEWFDEPAERFEALVLHCFQPFDVKTAGRESPHIRFVPAQRVAVPSHWQARPRYKVHSQHVLHVDLQAIADESGQPVEDAVVLAVGGGGMALLRPSGLSVLSLARAASLHIPEGHRTLRMDTVGAGQFVLVACLPQPLPDDVSVPLQALAESYLEAVDLAPLWHHLSRLSPPAVLLRHTVDIFDDSSH